MLNYAINKKGNRKLRKPLMLDREFRTHMMQC